MSQNKDKCNPPTDIPPQDIYSKISDLAKSLGASEVCTKAALTDAANFASSGGVSAGGYGVNAEGHYQVSGGATHNTMEESGCGPIMVAAQKIISNSKQIQCIIQRATKESNTSVNLKNNLDISTTRLTPDETAAQERLVAIFKAENPEGAYVARYIDMVNAYNQTVQAYNNSNPKLKPNPLIIPSITDAQNAYNSSIKTITDSFNRDIYWENVNVRQINKGDILLIGQLSDNDKTTIAALASDISKTVSETDTQQKMGANALTPSAKSATDTTVSNNQLISGTQIAEKIAKINEQFQAENITTIAIPGKIVMKNVTFDQEIAISLATQAIVSSAIDAGIQSSTLTQSSSETKTKIKQESAGVDAIIKAQGEANAAAIAAGNAANWSAIIGSIVGFAGFIILIIFDQKSSYSYAQLGVAAPQFTYLNILKWVFLAIFLGFLGFAIYLGYSYFYPPTKTEAEKLNSLNRPISVYQNYWNALCMSKKDSSVKICCNKILTYDDVKYWDTLKSNLDVSIQMQNEFADANTDPKSISGMKCYDTKTTTTTTTTTPLKSTTTTSI